MALFQQSVITIILPGVLPSCFCLSAHSTDIYAMLKTCLQSQIVARAKSDMS